ncbi:hypothetical protein F444_07974 [Phytophthora nicotianae P1976]|uniref:Tc1-like transposase DDE domain-containing protein n=1 Tax=Phytophthora nicotianae P1976 TaxID=1317066 RepID=A0A081ACM5_PHYNI|nr:hypothetical protein F444_07974 [Phytophthora nicotianae P1976]
MRLLLGACGPSTPVRVRGISGGDWRSRIKSKSGRMPIDRDEVARKLAQVPVEERFVVRRTAIDAGITRHLVTAMLKDSRLHRSSTRIKPALTAQNKHMRVEHVLSYIDDESHEFESMENVVHIDEKRFNQDTNKRTYMLLDEELHPQRDRKSKNFIPKTMFLAAVARPRYDFHRKCRCNGKIGIWALTEEYVAQRSSQYRPTGTICTRNIESIDREQDNAKPHISPFDPDILAAGLEGGWSIRLIFQPPNSPDLNVLDLGLFASIQSLQYRIPIYKFTDLIDAVDDAYKTMSADTLDDIFLTLQSCMLCILKEDGGNQYKLPHMGKAKLRRANCLPRDLTCELELYKHAIRTLQSGDRGSVLLCGEN